MARGTWVRVEIALLSRLPDDAEYGKHEVTAAERQEVRLKIALAERRTRADDEKHEREQRSFT